MNVTAVTAAIAGGMLTALLAAGCGAQGAGPPQGTVQACANYGVRAIEQHVTVTRKPAACQDLSKAQVNEAVGKAIYAVAGGRHKAAWRRQAALAGVRLAYLVSPAQDTAAPQPPGSAIPGSAGAARRSSDVILGLAALCGWLLAAGSGSYILGGWIRRSGIRGLRARDAGLPPVVIFGHFTLAVAGLLVWVIYLATSQAALAWAAVGLLLPVAALGMAMVTLGPSGDRGPGTSSAAGQRAAQVAPAGRRTPVLVVVGHGLLAVSTVLLVVLAALGASGR